MSSIGLLQDNKLPDAESHSYAKATGGNGASGCGPQESIQDESRYDGVKQGDFEVPKYERRRLARELSRDGWA